MTVSLIIGPQIHVLTTQYAVNMSTKPRQHKEQHPKSSK